MQAVHPLSLCALVTLIASAEMASVQFNHTSNESNSQFQCKKIAIAIGKCISFDMSSGIRYEGVCPYSFRFDPKSYYLDRNSGSNYLVIVNVSSCSIVNEVMCGQLNRDGLLCSKCKVGYGPALYSSGAWKCSKCDNNLYLMWIVYLILELAPLTAFFIIVIIFNVRATSPPFTAYVFYCQYFTYLFKTNPYFLTYVINFINPFVYKLVFTVIEVWSLDFFRHVIPPFCVDRRITNINVLSLEMIPAFYPLVLILLTYILIELHARNFYLIVKLWRPFNRCVAKIRRSYDPKASIFNTFPLSFYFLIQRFCLLVITSLY